MTRRRTPTALAALIAAAALGAFLGVTRPGCAGAAGQAPRQSAAVQSPAGSPAPAASARAAAPAPGASERLAAVHTVQSFCERVDHGQLWSAAGLLASPRVWTRRQLRSVRSLRFRWARVLSQPDAHMLRVVARVRAAAGPGSPLHDGACTLLFTLGRVGTTSGGWLITAVTPGP
jgi:hypothetical protein